MNTLDIRYMPETTLGRSVGGVASAARFGLLAWYAKADPSDLRALLAQSRYIGHGAAPCDPADVPDADVAEALAGYRAEQSANGEDD